MLAADLNVKHLDDWYKVTLVSIRGNKQARYIIDKHYNHSLIKALAAVYPEHEWLPWKFRMAPMRFWSDPSNQRRFLEWAAKQLNVRQLDDWHNISIEEVKRIGGRGLLQGYYNNSLINALAAVYPEHEWLPWRFRNVPQGFWKDPDNHRRFFEWAARELGVEKLDDWYNVSSEDIAGLGGAGLLEIWYDSSLFKALSTLFPHHEWLPWKCKVTPRNFWSNIDNQRRFFDWAAKQLHIEQLDGWYDITIDNISDLGGKPLLRDYGGSLVAALAAAYPEHEWIPWRFNAPHGFWMDKANHKRFFEWASKQLNIANHEDWYNVSLDDIQKLGGAGLVRNYYMGSLAKALAALYPDVDWQPWRFKGYSSMALDISDEKLVRRYVEFVARELHIEELDDWYRVSLAQMRKLGGYVILAENGGLYSVLKRLYPEHPWDEERFNLTRGKKAGQRWVLVAVRQLFPDKEIFEEYYHPALQFSESSVKMTLDICIPSLSLAFEYQGIQHYRDLHMFGNASMTQDRDQEKVNACKAAGITLIRVPYWWDHSLEDLAATVRSERPDLIANSTIDTNNEEKKHRMQQLADLAARGVPIPQQQQAAK